MSAEAYFKEEWEAALDETIQRQPTFEKIEYYASGRASKQWPGKEGPDWWAENGPKFVDLWVSWRDHSGLTIAEVGDHNGEVIPAIELEVWAEVGDLSVKSVIDRVLTDGENYYIVDLKTGSMNTPWPLQLALNNLCLRATYGIDAKWGGYWKARNGIVAGGPHDGWHDLSRFTDEWLWDKVAKARSIRDQQLFIPNPNSLCNSACGVQPHCLAAGGVIAVEALFSRANLATVTHNGREEE